MRKVILENARTVVAQADAGSRDTLQRLSDLIAQYRTVEGRKTVVFFSEGFHQANVSRELEQVAAAAAQSYAVFYAFDLNRRAGTDIVGAADAGDQRGVRRSRRARSRSAASPPRPTAR